MIRIDHTPYAIEALLMLDGAERGHFSVSKGNTLSMSIGIDEEYQKKGYARLLMLAVCNELQLDPTKRLYIDEDASEGFWGHLGMKDNPDYDEPDREKEGSGYAKYITFSDLTAFVGDLHKP